MYFTDVPPSTDVSDVQLEKMYAPMVVTLGGMETAGILTQFSKAPSPI